MGYKYEPNKIIKMYGGDNHEIFVTLNEQLGENDRLIFVLMEPCDSFDEPLIAKEFEEVSNTDTEYFIELEPADTEDLIPGLYYYSVKEFRYNQNIETQLDSVKTIIPKTKFIILE